MEYYSKIEEFIITIHTEHVLEKSQIFSSHHADCLDPNLQSRDDIRDTYPRDICLVNDRRYYAAKQSVISPEHSYEEITRNVVAEHCGNAPMDYNYRGTMTVQDERGNKYYLESFYSIEGETLTVVDEANHIKAEEAVTDTNQIREAEAMLQKVKAIQNIRGTYDPEARQICRECIELLEDHCTEPDSYMTLVLAYSTYAFILDVNEPELSASYSRKALSVVNAQSIDQLPGFQMEVISFM